MTWELSCVTFARTAAFVAIGACLLISSLAFFIGCGALGEVDGSGFGRFWGAFVFGAGEGVGRRNDWAFTTEASTSGSTSTITDGWRTRREITLTSGISVHAFEPTGEPARFIAFGRRIVNAIPQDGLRRFGKCFHRFASSIVGFHSFKDLQQAPTLPGVTLRGKNTFAFEVHIIDERIATVRGARDAIEAFLDLGVIGRAAFREHFRKRALQPVNEELSLQVDSSGEEGAQFFHWLALGRRVEFCARTPGAAVFRGHNRRQLGASARSEIDEFWKAFVERPADALWIPDKVTNPERGKIFSRVPGSEPRYRAAAFVLPDLVTDPAGFGRR